MCLTTYNQSLTIQENQTKIVIQVALTFNDLQTSNSQPTTQFDISQ